MNEDDYYTHVPLNVVGSLRAITPERLAQLLKAEADLAAARALLREWRECDEAGRHPECNAESWRPWRREIAAKVDAALAGEKNNGAS